ncbi:hypothetical protein PVK06_001068 [Gossypium arboreum]|uniref:Uncharacterized protein n=1 Tax=Gossypium arboreum TaxID=29729 RepID=A0ABR0R172_GOSAR|nr:hypothetical protein PVK06_001068 [Gossypium arboreum]
MTSQCSEKSFELEIKSTDNHIMQEQLQIKCFENEELHAKTTLLEQQVTSLFDKLSSFSHEIFEEHADEPRKKNLSQKIKSNMKLLEENSGLCFQNEKPTEEASYAKELTSVDMPLHARKQLEATLEAALVEK